LPDTDPCNKVRAGRVQDEQVPVYDRGELSPFPRNVPVTLAIGLGARLTCNSD